MFSDGLTFGSGRVWQWSRQPAVLQPVCDIHGSTRQRVWIHGHHSEPPHAVLHGQGTPALSPCTQACIVADTSPSKLNCAAFPAFSTLRGSDESADRFFLGTCSMRRSAPVAPCRSYLRPVSGARRRRACALPDRIVCCHLVLVPYSHDVEILMTSQSLFPSLGAAHALNGNLRASRVGSVECAHSSQALPPQALSPSPSSGASQSDPKSVHGRLHYST